MRLIGSLRTRDPRRTEVGALSNQLTIRGIPDEVRRRLRRAREGNRVVLLVRVDDAAERTTVSHAESVIW